MYMYNYRTIFSCFFWFPTVHFLKISSYRLDTGHSILQSLLCDDSLARCLPLNQVWTALVAAACQHTGAERLKVVNLLMQLISIHGKKSTEETTKTKLELSALKPIWQLYTTMIKKFGWCFWTLLLLCTILYLYSRIFLSFYVQTWYSADAEVKTKQMLAPEIVRVLTELFLTVEDLSEVRLSIKLISLLWYLCVLFLGVWCVLQEWGISQDLMVETLTKEGLHTWLEKGISNVAYISIALGLDNLASNKFIEAKVRVLQTANTTLWCYENIV